MHANPELCVDLAWASAWGGGRPDRVAEWLDVAEPQLSDDSPALLGWHDTRSAAAYIRATTVEAWRGGVDGALAEARRAIALEVDPGQRGYANARVALGRVLLGAGQPDEAARVLAEAWEIPVAASMTPVNRMQAGGALVAAWVAVGELERARRLCRSLAPAADELERGWGSAAAAALTLLRTAQGLLAHADGDLATACQVLSHDVELTAPGVITPTWSPRWPRRPRPNWPPDARRSPGRCSTKPTRRRPRGPCCRRRRMRCGPQRRGSAARWCATRDGPGKCSSRSSPTASWRSCALCKGHSPGGRSAPSSASR